ncbi:MAG: DUF1566 domain-containing protein, partial [Gammaproteobacteria bacterium]|nr:DUF1566 domain-containing protein [Gammaproteobacteria bacterium]
MKPNQSFFAICLVAALLTSTTDAAPCDPNVRPETTPTQRFVLGTDGTVHDKITGLTWMRCALGQQWDGKTCAGTAARYAWQ